MQAARVLKGKMKTLQKISMLILQCASRLSTTRAKKKNKPALLCYFYFTFILIVCFLVYNNV